MNSTVSIMSGAQGATGTRPAVRELSEDVSRKPGDSEFSGLVSRADASADEAGKNTPVPKKSVSENDAVPVSGDNADLDEKNDPGSAVALAAITAPDGQIAKSTVQAAELLKGIAGPEGGAAGSGGMTALAGVAAAGKAALDATSKQPVNGGVGTDMQGAPALRGILAGRDAGLPLAQAPQTRPETPDMFKSMNAKNQGSLMEKADAGFQSLVKTGQALGKQAGQPSQAAVFANLANALADKPALSAASSPGVPISTDGASSAISFENTLHVAADKTLPIQNVAQSSITDARSGAIPVNTVAIEMARQFRGGVNRFQIRLDPPELGRIDVRMHVTRDGNVSAHLVVEKPETLVALNRDAPALERALNTAGLNADKNALNFSLSGGNHGFTNSDDTGNAASEENTGLMAGDEAEVMEGRVEIRGYISPSGVDIHV